MAKHYLNINEEDYDFILIGLSFLKNHYEAAVAINNALHINLYLSDIIPFYLKDNKSFQFSLYRFKDEELGLDYYFIPNNSNFEQPNINEAVGNDLFSGQEIEESVKLVKELPRTDYFLILKGEDLIEFQHKVFQKLKSMQDVQQVQIIDVAELPSKRNLVF